ncbi:hypothetical protein [Solicola gregarius]|uniref:Uncharacterized protein n=1 Tax=Solicola gregarius TaxID=2908642 RepID=A0AA46TJX8_9ACTN|nr:hypothetical protein [Solicola gregarius]UYM06676.1 hypothetical protein L0C25_06290 [Solicola gregarius]
MINRTLKLLGVAAFAAVSTVSFGGAATADVDAREWADLYVRNPTDGDAGGVSLTESIIDGEGTSVAAQFLAEGERLIVYDDYDNDRSTVARLWVDGPGPEVFYSRGSRKEFDLSYDEGDTVHLQVCTSDSLLTICTEVKKEPGRT